MLSPMTATTTTPPPACAAAMLCWPSAGWASGLAGCGAARAGQEADAATTRVLAREVTEGPYWIDNKLMRRDITEGRHGLPLMLHLTVVDASTCKPIKGADVELWHADADGVYSGVELRRVAGTSCAATRRRNRAGRVRFRDDLSRAGTRAARRTST